MREFPYAIISRMFAVTCKGEFLYSIIYYQIKIIAVRFKTTPLWWPTCVSDRLSWFASSTLSGVDRYRWASNRFSSPFSCWSLKTVRAFRRRQCFPGLSCWYIGARGKPKMKVIGIKIKQASNHTLFLLYRNMTTCNLNIIIYNLH